MQKSTDVKYIGTLNITYGKFKIQIKEPKL